MRNLRLPIALPATNLIIRRWCVLTLSELIQLHLQLVSRNRSKWNTWRWYLPPHFWSHLSLIHFNLEKNPSTHRINREIMIEVDQEFIVTKTIQEVETDRDADVNFVGVYITGDDKVSKFSRVFLHQFPLNFRFLCTSRLSAATNWILWKSDDISQKEREDNFHGHLWYRNAQLLPRELWRKRQRRWCANPAEINWYFRLRSNGQLQLNDRVEWLWAASCAYKRRRHDRSEALADWRSGVLHTIPDKRTNGKLLCDWVTYKNIASSRPLSSLKSINLDSFLKSLI